MNRIRVFAVFCLVFLSSAGLFAQNATTFFVSWNNSPVFNAKEFTMNQVSKSLHYLSRLILCFIGFLSITSAIVAQQSSWPPAGQLSYSATSQSGYCETNSDGTRDRDETSTYRWTFTDASGLAHPFAGDTTSYSGCGQIINSELNEWSEDQNYYLSAIGIQGSITQQGGLINPLYKVVSILYATPGNASSDSFTNSTTDGSTTSVGSSFSSGYTTNFSAGFLGTGSSLTFGTSQTSGSSSSFTETIADASGVSNVSASSGPNVVLHNQDLFLIWLNPQIQLAQDSASNINYSLKSVGSQPTDVVQVTAEDLQANANGETSIPINILQFQFDSATGAYDLPGLAAVCTDQSQYVNNCPSGGQCGCVPSDFTAILATDPIVSTSTATNPLSVDTSGVQACQQPTSGSSCRYVPIPSTSGGTVQQDALLEGPQCSGCNRPVNSYTQTDSTATTNTLSESISDTVSFSYQVSFPLVGSFKNTNSWTWTDSESVGATNGTSNAIGYSLSSTTTGCYADVLIYEDTVFHTFVTQLAPGNTSCP